MLNKFFRKKRIWLALIWFAALITASLFWIIFLPAAAERMDFSNILTAPSLEHILGTDLLGRDLLARVLCGAGISLGVCTAAVGISVWVGVCLGAFAGYYGGWRDRVVMGFVDIMLCFPTFFLILAVIAVMGPNILNIMLVIGFTSWMGTARLVRAEVLSLKEREFVVASRLLGANDFWIITKHLIPNALEPVFVSAVLGISSAILMETGLSFLGIGVQPPTPSWGNILSDGKSALGVAWWLTLFPGFMIFTTVLAANILGEGLRGE